MIREPFDYTEWQRELYKDVPREDFLNVAMDFDIAKDAMPSNALKTLK